MLHLHVFVMLVSTVSGFEKKTKANNRWVYNWQSSLFLGYKLWRTLPPILLLNLKERLYAENQQNIISTAELIGKLE